MLSTIATAALINFLIVPISYHEAEPSYTKNKIENYDVITCLLYTSPSPRDG